MNPFKLLKNIYTTMLLHVMYDFPSKKSSGDLRYGTIKLTVQISWTLLLVYFVPLIVLKLIQKTISPHDAEKSVEDASEKMEAYTELSEYEWRNELTVLFRILEKRTTVDTNVIVAPDLETIVFHLIMGDSIFCSMRQETKNEFVERNISTESSSVNEGRNLEDIAKLTTFFEEQFDLITKHGRGDIFKEFYLGRKFMFLKINRGNSKKKIFEKPIIPQPS